MAKTHKAAVNGSTGQGGYGHGLDRVFQGLNSVALVAVADPVGLRHAGERLGVSNLYDDYNEMLEREKPDLVSISHSHQCDTIQTLKDTIQTMAITTLTS